MSAGQVPPAIPGEVWRDSFDGATWAIDARGVVHAWWPPAWLAWDAHPASDGEIARVLRAWAFAERARADAARMRAIRLAAEGDAMRDTAVVAVGRDADPVEALRAILAVPRACRTCGRVVEPARQCNAVPTCYACLPPPPPLETFEVLT